MAGARILEAPTTVITTTTAPVANLADAADIATSSSSSSKKHGLCTTVQNLSRKEARSPFTRPRQQSEEYSSQLNAKKKRAREASPCNTESGTSPKKLDHALHAQRAILSQKTTKEVTEKKDTRTEDPPTAKKNDRRRKKKSPIQERTPRTRSPAATAVSPGPVVPEPTHATNVAGGKWHKVKSKPRPIKKKRPDVIMVKCKHPSNYAMVLKSVHTDAGIQQYKENVCAVRRTAAGEPLLQLTKPADEATAKLQQAVKQALGDTADVKAITVKALVEIKHLAEFHTADLELIDEDLPAECHTKMRKAYSGTQSATMMVNPNLANKLLQAGKIRVGMCICRVRLKTDPDFGHTAARCRSKHDASKLCFNCGSNEHASKQSYQKAACILCTRHKRTNTAHNTLSRACPLFVGTGPLKTNCTGPGSRFLNSVRAIFPYTHHSWTQNHRYGAAIWSNSRTHLKNQHSADGYVRARYNGVYVYSCYIAPSKHIEEFCSILDELVEDPRTHTPTIIAGDFNAWPTEWGGQRTPRRGRALLDAFATLNISLLNVGNTHTTTKLGHIVATLFNSRPTRNLAASGTPCAPIFTDVSEVVESGKRINVHKAPGPDGLPALVICKHALTFVELFNTCMLQREFPTRWKLQRLEKELEQRHGLSDWQFGFRRKRSTINAISSVDSHLAEIAIEGQRWKNGNKKYCLISTLDVRNAFNSASCDSIIASLERLNIFEYIINLIYSYFRDRVLLYDTAAGPRKHTITGGVPQGSVIGPTLWNVMYDTVLRLDMPTDSRTISPSSL
ncbi:uncharacterized protein [Drosophila tropicalis]|uniref:uncharacterized protein n=1 Tax=Drosophila tropicalis TaxID=46794 RepID=UPI0035ABAE5C